MLFLRFGKCNHDNTQVHNNKCQLFITLHREIRRSLSSNFTRTDSSVIKQIQKNRTLWQVRRVDSFRAIVKINLRRLIKRLTITSEVSVLLSVMIVHYPFTRYFWLLHSECGLCSRLPPSGHTQALRKQLPSSHRCSCN